MTRRHEHFYPWSEVRAHVRREGPAPRCRFCGRKYRPRLDRRVRWAMAGGLRRLARLVER